MKNAEDEAFDEIAKKQGAWGGGYQAKREAAMDRLVQEQERLGLYDPPPQREWVGLTDEETSGFTQHEMTVAKYVSKVLQEKNT
jgi:hypothetical protein